MEIQKRNQWFSASLKLALILAICFLSCKVYAEYDMVAGSPCYRGYSCRSHCHHKKYKHSRHRYHRYSPYGVSISYVCPTCVRTWVPGRCNRCGHWIRGHWVSYTANVYFEQPAYYKDYGYHEDLGYGAYDYPYDPDLSTGDDNAMADPDMDIDH